MSTDRITTQMQEVGHAAVIGEPLTSLVRVCDNLALDPSLVRVNGVVRVRSVAPGEPSYVRAALNAAVTALDAIDRGDGDPRDLARKGLSEAGALTGDGVPERRARRTVTPAPDAIDLATLLSDDMCDRILNELVVLAGGEPGRTDDRVPFARWDMKRALTNALAKAQGRAT